MKNVLKKASIIVSLFSIAILLMNLYSFKFNNKESEKIILTERSEYNTTISNGSTVPSTITTDTFLEKGTYTIYSNLVINSGVTLEVEAGTILNFPSSITINGTLLLNGTEQERITFKPYSTSSNEIIVSTSGVFTASYTDISGLNGTTAFRDVIQVSGTLKLDNCTVAGTSTAEFYSIQLGLYSEITNSEIGLSINVSYTNVNNVIIENNIIKNGVSITKKPTGILRINNNESVSTYPVSISLSVCDKNTFENIRNNTNAVEKYNAIYLVDSAPVTDIRLTKQNYIIKSDITVPANTIFEVDAGSVININSVSNRSYSISVYGELLLNGTEDEKITLKPYTYLGWKGLEVFTTGIVDASYTDFLELTAPDYSTVVMSSDGILNLDHSLLTNIERANETFSLSLGKNSTITNSELNQKIIVANTNSNNITIENNTIKDGIVVMKKVAGTLKINDNKITKPYIYPVTIGLSVSSVNTFENIKNNTATTESNNAIYLSDGLPTANVKLTKQNYILNGDFVIPVNTVFEVEKGIKINLPSLYLISVSGQLIFNGTEEEKIVLKHTDMGSISVTSTGTLDASYTDFSTVEPPTSARSAISSSGTLILDHCTIRRGTTTFGDYIYVGLNTKITNSEFEQQIYVNLRNPNNLIIENNNIKNNIIVANKPTGIIKINNNKVYGGSIYPVTIGLSMVDEDTFANITNNINTDNDLYSAIYISDGTPNTNIKLTKQAYVINQNITIPSNLAFEVENGSVLKFNSSYGFSVSGLLNLVGTKDSVITLTNPTDSEFGGTGAANYWGGIKITSTGMAVIFNTDIRRTGANSTYAIQNSGSLIMVNSSITKCQSNAAIKYDTISTEQGLKNNFISGGVASNAIIDATYNYWGAENGPRRLDPGTNTYVGDGFSVSNNISIYPFNTSFIKTDVESIELITTRLYELRHFGKSGVNAFTGNYSKQLIDFEIINNNIDLKFSRTYNSKNSISSILGYGWSFGFSSKVQNLYDPNSYIVYLPDGSINIFTKEGNTFTAEDSRNTFKIENNKYILTKDDQTVYTYNINGNLETITDKYGNKTQVVVNSNGNIERITDCFNRVYTLEYNSNNLLSKITDPIGRTVKYSYNSNNMLETVTDVNGVIITYSYNNDKKLINIKQNNIEIEKIEYITTGQYAGRVYKVTNASDNTTIYSYDEINNVTTEIATGSYVTNKYFDRDGYITKIIDPYNKTTLITYNLISGINKYGERLTITDINSNKTTYERDNLGRIIKIINPDASVKKYTYNVKNNIIMEVDELSNITEYIYDNDNVTLLKVVKPIDGFTLYNSDNNSILYEMTLYSYYNQSEVNGIKGLIKTKSDLNGTTTYEYDSYGNPASVTLDNETKTVYTSNKLGWILSERTNNKYMTSYEYNNYGSIAKTVKDSNIISEIIYNYQNKPVKVVDGNGNYESFEYDKAGNVIKQIDKEGNVTGLEYDTYSNLVKKTYPNESINTYTYDKLNRVLKTYFKESESSDTVLSEEKIYVEGTSYSVTTRNYISSTSYKGKIEKYNYLNKMVSLQTETNIDNYTYLANGLLSIEKTANSSATYYYYNKTNRLDRMYKQTTATEYAATFYVYDNFGRLIEEKIGNEKVALNSTPLTFTTTTYTYDSVGRVITKATSSGEYITYLYDEFNNVIKETTKINSEQNKVKQYEYNYLNKVAKDKEEDIIITYQYDGIGNITKEVRGNRVSEYTYDKLGNLVKKKLNGSIEEELFYDNMSNVTKSIDANGNATTYIYDKQNNKVKETNAKSLSTEYTYDLVGRVLTVKNPIGTTTVYTYDKFDNVLQKTIADEIIYKYTYDKNHNLLQATDPELNVTTYVYDNLDNLVNVTDARSGVTSYVYNAKSQLIQETNAKNQVTIYRYDESGNLINKGIKATATGTEVIVEQNTYDLLNNLVTKKDGNLNTTTYNYNNKGQLIKITNPLGYIQEFTYNIFGEVIKINDNLEKEIIKEYDIKGNITKEIKQKTDESESIQIIKEYDKNNNVTKEIDGNVNITLYFYDNLNNLTKIKNPKGQETTYIYDSNNNLIKETNYLEDFKSYSYDKHDRLIETRNELDEIIEKKEYDKNSRQVKSIDANGYVYTYVYGKTGNLYQKIDELGGTYLEKYDCDLLNNIITKTDKKGNITNYEYDQFQNLVKVTNALNEVTTYEYDNNGNLIKVKDGRGKISEYTYDALNNELTEKDALGNIEYKEYSINGLLNKRITRKEDIINYTYDIHGRLIEENDISYIYDNNSNLTEVTELDKEIIRTYDELDRVITKLEDGLLSRYSYDINGYKEKSIDPLGNEVIKVYDKVGRLIKVNEEVEYTYNADGTLKKLVYANGASEEYFYNQDKTLNKLININGEDTQEYKYEYDTYKNIIKEISPSGTVINTYDALNRLKTVTRNGSTTTYTYDASGNRTKEVTGTKTKDYIYSSTNVLNQITEKNSSVVTQIITYDNDTNGNQVKEYVNSVLTRTNTYNYKNELIGMTKENTTTNYEYNAEGKRVSKNSGIDTIKFIYEGTKVILELDGNNDKIATNIYGQALLKRTTVDYSGYYLYNGHGDVVTIIDEENEVLDSYEYDAWGNLISNEITSIESRNLFDKNNSSQIVSLFTHSGSTTLVANNTVKSVFTPCEPNTQYTVSKLSGARFTVSTVAQVPTAGLTRTLLAENNSATTLTVTTPSNAKYLIVYVYVSTGDTLSLEEILGSIQIELGPVATEYEPYGIMEIINNTTEGINNPYRYSGYYYDEETDNYYLMARYYNPVIARFISEDTYRGEYRDPLSLNRYVYVNNNPLIYYDPSGYFLEGVWDWYKYRVDKTVDGLHQIGGPLEYIGLRVVGITDGVFEGIYGLGNLVEAEVNTVGALLDFGITELAYQTGMMDDKTRLDRFEKIDKTLNKSYKTLSTIPQMPGAMLNTIGTTINPVNIVKYLDPNTTDYEFLKKQGTATVGTALLAKGIVDGVKSIQWSSNTLTIPTGAPNIDGSIPAVTVTYPTIAGVDTASMNQALIKAGTGLSSISGGNIGDKQRKGTPKNNQVQNKQVDDIVKKYKLSKAQRRILHDEISGQNLTFKEIESIAIEIINGNY